jgi:ketosteroid isomerase-like protein
MSVFTSDPVFVETPFSEPLRGTVAVRRFWLEVPLHQSEIRFTSGEIFAAGPWFSTEFKCVYRRKRTGEWVDARGAIFCETDGGKVSEMRMYWHRFNGGRETGKP